MKRKQTKLHSFILPVILAIVMVFTTCYNEVKGGIVGFFNRDYIASAPLIQTDKKDAQEGEVIGDFYVSTNGDDENSGTKDAPFRTVERAAEAVRNTDKTGRYGITVCIEAGEYRISSLKLTKEDSGTADCPITYRSYNGEVVFNGGATLNADDFSSVRNYPEIAQKLTDEAKENVVVLDLTKAPYSLSKDDWGKIYAVGSYHTAANYDGDYVGPLYCELFVNDQRQTIARYPDSGYLQFEEVVKTGLGRESGGSKPIVENWYEIRNPETDIYRVDAELAERIAGWENLDDVWMFGYWMYDWADASSPVGYFNAETREISPKFVSLFGTKPEAPYYFFNVPEELSTEGEWYLDRENGLLCFWKPADFESVKIDLSLSLESIINSEADYVTFDGFTVKGTRGDAITITADNNTVKNCLIKNVAGNALVMTGSNNLASCNEITRTGKGGIILSGGDANTLTPGNSIAENNYIHDWSEIYQTYQPAVTLEGVGNICAHNEIFNAPHEAIAYKGNNHIVEYNLVHDVCLLSDDAGAIYSGRSWTSYGNIIRYNCIYDLGSGDHEPNGIYLDDALSGQKVYGNLLINIPRNAILVGGGRDNLIDGNVIVNAGLYPLYIDERARDAALNEGWFTHAHIGSGDMWDVLYASPWQSEIWQTAFPEYGMVTDDVSKSDSASYIPNPANTVTNNLIIDKRDLIGRLEPSVIIFSEIEDNAIYAPRKADKIFVDAENGDYRIKDIEKIRKTMPGFEEIPLDKIGRTVG